MIGNIVDPISAARLRRNEQHSDDDVCRTLDGIRQRCLAPYYEQLENDNGKQKCLKDKTKKTNSLT
jgi:hypothetical protein